MTIYPVRYIYPSFPLSLFLGCPAFKKAELLNKARYKTVTVKQKDLYELIKNVVGTNFVIGVYKEYEESGETYYNIICDSGFDIADNKQRQSDHSNNTGNFAPFLIVSRVPGQIPNKEKYIITQPIEASKVSLFALQLSGRSVVGVYNTYEKKGKTFYTFVCERQEYKKWKGNSIKHRKFRLPRISCQLKSSRFGRF